MGITFPRAGDNDPLEPLLGLLLKPLGLLVALEKVYHSFNPLVKITSSVKIRHNYKEKLETIQRIFHFSECSDFWCASGAYLGQDFRVSGNRMEGEPK